MWMQPIDHAEMPMLWGAASRETTRTSLYIGFGGLGAVPNGIVLKEEET